MQEKSAQKVGAIVQGIVLGSMLFAALVRLFALAEKTRVFRYQDF